MIIRELKTSDTKAVESIFDLYWTGVFRENLSERIHNSDLHWMVAEENGEVVGVASYRTAPERMREFAKTDRVAELYVIAARQKEKGIGSVLRNSLIEAIKQEGFLEIVFFSGDTHKDSWSFHDASRFKRVGESTAPDGEKGFIWLLEL